SMTRRTTLATPFPYTTLFRSVIGDALELRAEQVTQPRESSCPGEDSRGVPKQEPHNTHSEHSSERRRDCAQTRHEFRYQQRPGADRKSTRLNSSHGSISYAVF